MLLPAPLGQSVLQRHNALTGAWRRLSSKTASKINAFEFGAFERRLRVAARRAGVAVVRVSERNTSSTCGACGLRRADDDLVKSIACAGCHAVWDRDGSAARSILLLWLHKVGVLGDGTRAGACVRGRASGGTPGS